MSFCVLVCPPWWVSACVCVGLRTWIYFLFWSISIGYRDFLTVFTYCTFQNLFIMGYSILSVDSPSDHQIINSSNNSRLTWPANTWSNNQNTWGIDNVITRLLFLHICIIIYMYCLLIVQNFSKDCCINSCAWLPSALMYLMSKTSQSFSSLHWLTVYILDSLIINSYSASHDNWCTATLWNRIMTAQCEGMGEVGSARYEPALLPPCPSIRALCYSNCQRSTQSHQQSKTLL